MTETSLKLAAYALEGLPWALSVSLGRALKGHAVEEFTYQPHSPIGLDLELLNRPLRIPERWETPGML